MSNLKTTFFFSNWSQMKECLYYIVTCIAINVIMYCLSYYRGEDHHASFLLYLYGMNKSSILNWVKGNESSSFVSEISFTWEIGIYIKESNLILIKFIFTWSKISLSRERIFISFNQIWTDHCFSLCLDLVKQNFAQNFRLDVIFETHLTIT